MFDLQCNFAQIYHFNAIKKEGSCFVLHTDLLGMVVLPSLDGVVEYQKVCQSFSM